MLDIQEIKDGVQLAAQEYPIKKAELFGSYANGTNRPDRRQPGFDQASTSKIVMLSL